jgi:hypothetical protein
LIKVWSSKDTLSPGTKRGGHHIDREYSVKCLAILKGQLVAVGIAGAPLVGGLWLTYVQTGVANQDHWEQDWRPERPCR